MSNENCPLCGGTGMEVIMCEECGGDGWVYDPSDGGTMTCPTCDAFPDEEVCELCSGTGLVSK